VSAIPWPFGEPCQRRLAPLKWQRSQINAASNQQVEGKYAESFKTVAAHYSGVHPLRSFVPLVLLANS